MNDFQHAGAFVVQFRPSTDFECGQVEGRVEHIASGRTASFTSTGELLDMLARLWRHVEPMSKKGNGHDSHE
ncbi:MAG TPA: hypothetical protein VKB50_07120 [Vicinamibacterales bacterium]|nr:hypothetical protein [Vicinamibacterales bacterium]